MKNWARGEAKRKCINYYVTALRRMRAESWKIVTCIRLENYLSRIKCSNLMPNGCARDTFSGGVDMSGCLALCVLVLVV